MYKVHFTSFALTVTSCLADIKNGEFEIKLEDNAKKENFEKTFDTLSCGYGLITSSPKNGIFKNNNSVYFIIEKGKIRLCDTYGNIEDKYDFYSYSIKEYVKLNKKVSSRHALMNNIHEINDIKTCEVKFDISRDYIDKYKNLAENIKKLKKELFNDKDYGFLIFNDAYSKYIKKNYPSFNIEFKDKKFIITANKEYVEKGGIIEYKYNIKVFIDTTKNGDYVINDKYKNSNLDKLEIFTKSLGNKKSASALIEAFKEDRYHFNREGYELCDVSGKEIKGDNLASGTYYVKNDKFYTKKTILDSYNKFLKYLNESLVNGVEGLIDKDSISKEEFTNKMTAINNFFKKFEDKENERDETDKYKEYKSLFKDSNYGEIIDSKFEYLNKLRRKLMAMYIYKNVITNVTGIINKLQKGEFNDLNIDDFFDNKCEVKNYSENFIHKIYKSFKGDFIKKFYVNKECYDNDVKNIHNTFESTAVAYEIKLIDDNNYNNLQKNLEELLEKNKDNLLKKYEIKVDTTDLTETDAETLSYLINEINFIKKKVLYCKPKERVSYESLLKTLNLHKRFYIIGHRVLFFDIFVGDEKVVFDCTKDLDNLLNETLPEGKHTILLKFYDCVEAYNRGGSDLEKEEKDFNKLLIAQIARKDYKEKEIEKINNITSKEELNKNYKEIIEKKGKYSFLNEIQCLKWSGIASIVYKHSEEEEKDYICFDNLPSIYNAVTERLLQLEKGEMNENERKGVEEIENKYKGLVDIIIKEINSTETLEKLKELPYSKKEDIKKDLENKVKSEVDNYDNKKSKISDFDIFVNNYVEQVYNAYNTKSSGIIKDEEEKKIKAAEEEEKRKKDEEDKRKRDDKDKEKKDEGNNTVQTITEDNNTEHQNTKKQCCKSNKKSNLTES